jgi:hypothetical protein
MERRLSGSVDFHPTSNFERDSIKPVDVIPFRFMFSEIPVSSLRLGFPTVDIE